MSRHRPRHPRATLLCLALVACQSGTPAPAAEAAPAPTAAAQAATAAATAAAAAAGVTPFAYSSVGKRDPYRSYLVEVAEAAARSSPDRKREETEHYEMDQYRLTGLVTGTSRPKAMVEDPSGHGHVLHVGSRLGRNGGRIASIATSGVTVVEEMRDPTGKKVNMSMVMKLPKSEVDSLAQDN